MENFIFQNPVKLIMGHGMIARLSKEIPSDKRIMITFGGGSVKKNGVYDQVKEALKDHFTIEFWLRLHSGCRARRRRFDARSYVGRDKSEFPQDRRE